MHTYTYTHISICFGFQSLKSRTDQIMSVRFSFAYSGWFRLGISILTKFCSPLQVDIDTLKLEIIMLSNWQFH